MFQLKIVYCKALPNTILIVLTRFLISLVQGVHKRPNRFCFVVAVTQLQILRWPRDKSY